MFDPAIKAEFLRFVVARHEVYLNRKAKKPWPWTDDPILRDYRFCNVYRELDHVTKYIRERYEWDRTVTFGELTFDLVVARLINNPDTLADLPLYSRQGWNPKGFIHTLHRRRDQGQRVFNPAYIVSTNGQSMDKAEYLATHVLQPLWDRQITLKRHMLTLAEYHRELTSYQGLGSFMAAQVVADMKNTVGSPLFKATDWWGWAAPGPGSTRGLNRLVGEGPKTSWSARKHGEWLEVLEKLRFGLNARLHRVGMPQTCAQDTQNCLCEFDKYMRAKDGTGTPKQKFTPAEAAARQRGLFS